MILARYGKLEIIVGSAIGVAGTAASLIWLPWISPVFILGLIFLLSFFRDPPRRVPAGADDMTAPADGKVVAVDEVEEDEYIGGPAVRIAIFLSVFNCHINRAPCGGRVEYTQLRRGKFHAAWGEEASSENEQNSIGMEMDGERGLVLVKQIAGLVARRIVCAVDVGDRVEKGQKIGMIKFGSRTELYAAKSSGFVPSVSVGDKVKAGLTIIGRFSASGSDGKGDSN